MNLESAGFIDVMRNDALTGSIINLELDVELPEPNNAYDEILLPGIEPVRDTATSMATDLLPLLLNR
ncbi:MAG: hypothetical protein AMDU2_EPLC00014G0025 [Thermoplasmatales archaeon E-plasma]|nr:MAG: hypothetical protein AMDU2_EPLC00014G0025 [Thermoplasmatales archaeon E-plasma]